MLKISFINEELEELKSKIYFTDRQLEIIEYRRKGYSRVKMSELLHLSVQGVDYEIDKINKKIKEAYDKGILKIN